jgi:hypothetical protein
MVAGKVERRGLVDPDSHLACARLPQGQANRRLGSGIPAVRPRGQVPAVKQTRHVRVPAVDERRRRRLTPARARRPSTGLGNRVRTTLEIGSNDVPDGGQIVHRE